MAVWWKRICLVVMVVVSAVAGPWAYFAPMNWYANFPGFGLKWLPQLGPYNQHFASDIGAMYLAFGVLSAIALWKVRDVRLVRTVGTGWLVFNVLHFIYHMSMLDMYSRRDQVLNVVTLSLLVLASVVLVLPARSRRTGGDVGGATRPRR